MKNVFIIVLSIIISAFILIFMMYKVDMDRMEHGYDVVFSTWGYDYEPGMHNFEEELKKK